MSYFIRAFIAINDSPETLRAAGSTDIQEGEAIYRKYLEERWMEEKDGEEFPDDLDEAKDELLVGVGCMDDSFWFEEVLINSRELTKILEIASVVSSTLNPSTEDLVLLRKALAEGHSLNGGPLVEELPKFPSFVCEIEGSQDCFESDANPITSRIEVNYQEAKKMWQIANFCCEGVMGSGLLDAHNTGAFFADGSELISVGTEYQVFKNTFRVRGETKYTYESWFTKELDLKVLFEHFKFPCGD